MDILERKFQIAIKEWEHIRSSIQNSAESKFKIKGWAITIFSGIFALSFHLKNTEILLIAVATTILFWIFDAIHQSVQTICFKREHEIEEFLENPTDEDIMGFNSPIIGRNLNKNLNKNLIIKSLTSVGRILFFGSMMLILIFSYLARL